MTMQSLAFYAQPFGITAAASHTDALASLPTNDLAALVSTVQGLVLHEHHVGATGVKLTSAKQEQTHMRSAERMLGALLDETEHAEFSRREPAARLLGVCRHFVVLLVTCLRSMQVPARARTGFASYFTQGLYEDHWVCEYWDVRRSKWILVDPQIDAAQRSRLRLDFDPLDVPRSSFIVAPQAWRKCRLGEIDPVKFGIYDARGLWFVASTLVRDFAALNKREMLPWDAWGAMVRPSESISPLKVTLFDKVALIGDDPDHYFHALRDLYELDASLRVPEVVLNTRLSREEFV